jgi:hypothetical protein
MTMTNDKEAMHINEAIKICERIVNNAESMLEGRTAIATLLAGYLAAKSEGGEDENGLKSCPFCSSPARVGEFLKGDQTRCSNEDCFMSYHFIKRDRWNRRS